MFLLKFFQDLYALYKQYWFKKYLDVAKLTIIEKLFVVFYQKEEVETKRITRVKEEGIQLVTF